ncbi:MAG: NAD(P)H-dependent oxidoreductase [Pseudomonadota bacterium]|nr:NAD(P)H-dependent oxidoreductase [Pseudomonadota bacterium]
MPAASARPCRVLIVHAHPEPHSFCAALRDAAVSELRAAGCQVEVSDLYARGFNPVAAADDFRVRRDPDYLVYALEQRHAVEQHTLLPEIQAEIDKVLACDLLILSFPVFWFSMPAMLKGWIDRVFVSGLFYGGRRIYGQGGMRGKRALVCATLGGREHMFGTGALHGDLIQMFRPLLQGSLAYVGMEVLTPFFGYHVPYLDDAGRAAILAAWRQALRERDQRASLAMPDLERFDREFRPL